MPQPGKNLDDIAKRDALGKATAAESAWLRSPPVLPLWRNQLVDMIQATMAEQTSRRAMVQEAKLTFDRLAYETAMRDHAEWASRAAHFRQAVEVRLRECKLRMAEHRRVTLSSADALAARLAAVESRLDSLEGRE